MTLRERFRRWRTRRICRRIRRELEWWGSESADATDEQIIESITRFAAQMRALGLTQAEISGAFARAAKAPTRRSSSG